MGTTENGKEKQATEGFHVVPKTKGNNYKKLRKKTKPSNRNQNCEKIKNLPIKKMQPNKILKNGSIKYNEKKMKEAPQLAPQKLA